MSDAKQAIGRLVFKDLRRRFEERTGLSLDDPAVRDTLERMRHEIDGSATTLPDAYAKVALIAKLAGEPR